MEHAALTCIECGHVWHPHYPHRKPRICPNCRSQHWEKPKETQATPAVGTLNPQAPVAETIDPTATAEKTQRISNDVLVEEIKDLRKQIELLKEKMEKLEKLCNSGLYIKTL